MCHQELCATVTLRGTSLRHVLGEDIAHQYVEWDMVAVAPVPDLLTVQSALQLSPVVGHREGVSPGAALNVCDGPAPPITVS